MLGMQATCEQGWEGLELRLCSCDSLRAHRCQCLRWFALRREHRLPQVAYVWAGIEKCVVFSSPNQVHKLHCAYLAGQYPGQLIRVLPASACIFVIWAPSAKCR